MMTNCIVIAILLQLIRSNTAADSLTSWTEIDLNTNNLGAQVAGYDDAANTAWLLGGNCGCCGCNDDVYSYSLSALSSSGVHSALSVSFSAQSQSYVTLGTSILFVESGRIHAFDMTAGTLDTHFAALPIELDNACLATDGDFLFITGGRCVYFSLSCPHRSHFLYYAQFPIRNAQKRKRFCDQLLTLDQKRFCDQLRDSRAH